MIMSGMLRTRSLHFANYINDQDDVLAYLKAPRAKNAGHEVGLRIRIEPV